jgi:hypothetical protein
MTGITYAVVALSKESRVGDNGVMVVKGSDTPVATGAGGCGGLRGAAGGCGGLLRHHLDLYSQPSNAQRP